MSDSPYLFPAATHPLHAVSERLKVREAVSGFGIALRIQQVSQDLLQLNQGTLYPALLRLQQRGWIVSKWGLSENNRKARFYSLTRDGRKQLKEEAASWGRMSTVINRVLTSS